MDRERRTTDVSGDERVAESPENPISATPGRLEDKEDAAAYATRTGQEDVTSLRPRHRDARDRDRRDD